VTVAALARRMFSLRCLSLRNVRDCECTRRHGPRARSAAVAASTAAAGLEGSKSITDKRLEALGSVRSLQT
jgi:hypothetical protein